MDQGPHPRVLSFLSQRLQGYRYRRKQRQRMPTAIATICLEKRPVMLEQRLHHRPQARAVRGSDKKRALHWEGLCLTGGGSSHQRTSLGAAPVNREICREFAR